MLTHCGTKEINTERLLLRPFTHNDNEDMLKYWVSDPKIQLMYSEPVYKTKDEVQKLLDKYISSYQKEDYYRWAIIESKSNFCIGQIAIFLVDDKNHFCEIEYCIGSMFQRKGYCNEAVQAIIQYAFNSINIHKMQVCHKENNMASKKFTRKFTLLFIGRIFEFRYFFGEDI